MVCFSSWCNLLRFELVPHHIYIMSHSSNQLRFLLPCQESVTRPRMQCMYGPHLSELLMWTICWFEVFPITDAVSSRTMYTIIIKFVMS